MAGGRAKRPGKAGKPRAARAVLGNDPFERGAAVREAPGARVIAAPPPAAPPVPPPTPSPASFPGSDREEAAGPPATPAAGPPPQATETGVARELAELASSLLPAMREKLRGLAGLFRIGETGAHLDAHGMDPTLLVRAAPLLDFLYLTWWRVEATSAASLPEGPVVVVANHGGSLPWDALVLRLAVRRETPSHLDLRPLLDAATFSLPLVGRAAARLGAVPATPENALRLLSEGAAVGVFPEGTAPRSWSERYRIGAFGRGGFVKLALRAGAAIVPCAIVGSEEASPPVGRAGFLAETFRFPLLAGLPGFSVGPLAGLPLPSRWTLRFGEPLDTGGLGPEAARDPAAVARLAAEARGRLQALLDEAVAARRSVYL